MRYLTTRLLLVLLSAQVIILAYRLTSISKGKARGSLRQLFRTVSKHGLHTTPQREMAEQRYWGSAAKLDVWKFPRPPACEKVPRHLKVVYGGQGIDGAGGGIVLAETKRSYWVLETSHPPTYYIPQEDVNMKVVNPDERARSTYCEWKGTASYYKVEPTNDTDLKPVRGRIWTYHSPTARFSNIKDHYSFYAGPWRCYVDGEEVKAQDGDFYGGWITSDIVGKTKGGPGTWGW